jgi:hypothetical protein
MLPYNVVNTGAAAEEMTTLRAELRAAKRMVENYERDMDRVAEELETSRGDLAQADRKVSHQHGGTGTGGPQGNLLCIRQSRLLTGVEEPFCSHADLQHPEMDYHRAEGKWCTSKTMALSTHMVTCKGCTCPNKLLLTVTPHTCRWTTCSRQSSLPGLHRKMPRQVQPQLYSSSCRQCRY